MEQDYKEIEWLAELMKRERFQSLLEIGSRDGGSLNALAKALPKGAVIRSIDIKVLSTLTSTVEALRIGGFDAACFQADSRSPEAHGFALSRAPYDLVFIDGDHSLECASSDWLMYGDMAKFVAFHDISDGFYGVKKLWADICEKYNTRQISVCETRMGIGVVRTTDYR